MKERFICAIAVERLSKKTVEYFLFFLFLFFCVVIVLATALALQMIEVPIRKEQQRLLAFLFLFFHHTFHSFFFAILITNCYCWTQEEKKRKRRRNVVWRSYTNILSEAWTILLDNVFFILQYFLAYLSPPLINSPTFRSCNLLGRNSRSKCSMRSGSSWPRLPTTPVNCFVRRLEMLVKLENNDRLYYHHEVSLISKHTAGFQLVSDEEPCSLALNRKKNKWSISQ